MKSIIIISSIMLITALQLVAQEKKEIFFADPTIWVDGGKYYLTGTKGGGGTPGFAVLESKDLKNWAPPKGSSSPEYMILSKGDQSFGTVGFWAPQIFKADQTYYLTYTANEQTVLAESKSFLGPYRQKEVAPIDGSVKNIDSFVFKDDDGKYYLFYSANHFKNIDYSIGYAVSDSPFGPWVKSEENPILHRSVVGENGSGHGDLFEGLDGQLYYVYHIHFDQQQVAPRRTRIVPVLKEWDAENGQYKFSMEGTKVMVPVLSK